MNYEQKPEDRYQWPKLTVEGLIAEIVLNTQASNDQMVTVRTIRKVLLPMLEHIKQKHEKENRSTRQSAFNKAVELITENLLIKCECENGDCPNCLRTCALIDGLSQN